MANSKKRCVNCKSYFPTEIGITAPVGFFCGNGCRLDYAFNHTKKLISKSREIEIKKHAKKKRAFKLSDIKLRKKMAVKACHAYIRERDKDQLCICCKKPLGDNYHAGHWLESGNNPQVRFDENNIHAQKLACNFFKGGDSGDYEKNLRAKIGNEKVDELLGKKGGTSKLTASDYLAIENNYKRKLKQLK